MIVITAQGRLAHQPEVRMLAQGCVCEFRLLSNRFARGQEHVEAVTFFCYDEEAEVFCERAEKGQLISATGTQETHRWTDGSGQERISIKYRLTWWEAGPRPKGSRQQEQAPSGRQAPARPEQRRQAPHRSEGPAHLPPQAAQQDDDSPQAHGII